MPCDTLAQRKPRASFAKRRRCNPPIRRLWPSVLAGMNDARARKSFAISIAKRATTGLRLTAHAGETAGAESIWSAINIGAERIGHALSAQHDGELLEMLAKKQIPLEICITSNLRTGCCTRLEDHPVRQYFDCGLMVTLNSDDPTMFGSNLNDEYLLAHRSFGLTLEHLRELAGNSIEASFLPPARKLELLRRVEQYAEPGT